jgi:hypothetical protein
MTNAAKSVDDKGAERVMMPITSTKGGRSWLYAGSSRLPDRWSAEPRCETRTERRPSRLNRAPLGFSMAKGNFARPAHRRRQFQRQCGNYGIDSPNERRQIETTGRQSRELFRPVAARRARSRRYASGVGTSERCGVSQVYIAGELPPECLLYAAAVRRRTTVTVDPMATPRLRQPDRSRSLQGRGRGTPAPTRR